MVDIGIVGDTHLTQAHQANLSSVLRKAFREVDHIIHTGDFTSEDVFRDLELIAPVTACHGNMDSSPLKKILPTRVIERFGSVKICVMHQPPAEDQIRELVGMGVKIIISGHTHVPKIEESEAGVLLLNPGSPTHPRAPPENKFIPWLPRPAVPTIMLLRISGDLSHAYIIRLQKT